MKKSLLLLVLIFSVWLLNGCGGSSSGSTRQDVVTQFSIIAATSTPTAGAPFNITVTALNAAGQMVATYSGTVSFTSSNGQPVLPGSGILANGTGTFPVSLSTPGSQTISVSDSISGSGTSSKLNVTAAVATQFSISTPASATAGTVFSFSVTAKDASNNVVTSYAGTVHFTSIDAHAVLPADSILTNGTATFSATFKSAGNETITATDLASPSITGISSSITVAAAGMLAITSAAPPNGEVGIVFGGAQLLTVDHVTLSYSGWPLAAIGGVQGYNWSWSAAQGSSLPPGLNVTTLTLTSGGGTRCCVTAYVPVIGGTATATGTYHVIVAVSDSGSPAAQATANYTLIIANGTSNSLAITSEGLPNGTAGQAYDDTVVTEPCIQGTRNCVCIHLLMGNACFRKVSGTNGFPVTASGGTPAYTWSWAAAIGSSLPVGLTIDINTGIISGNPLNAGSFNVVVTVSDSSSPPTQASANYALLIDPPAGSPATPVITTTAVPTTFTLNLDNGSFAFAATDGVPPYTWSASGSLPPGLVFSEGGVLYGKPTAAGTFPVTLTLKDSTGAESAPVELNIPVFPHGFALTGSMSTARVQHTATLLDTGSVLITGGQDEMGDISATAELYDPPSGTFTRTGIMGNARAGHTATLLCNLFAPPCNNDRVLITGGNTTVAELYDPLSASFAITGAMQTTRIGQTATLLVSGKVLVAGGGADSRASAEVFDPSLGTFAPVGNMVTGRSNHTAVLLDSGMVLLMGGRDANGNSIASAELFDPSKGIFTSTGSMTTPRSEHTATLLCNLPASPHDNIQVLVTGGVDVSGAPVGTTELYNPNTGAFSAASSMTIARASHLANLLQDLTVLISGPDPTAEIYNPTNGKFTETGSMTVARGSDAATLLVDGTVLITGGNYVDVNSAVRALASAELYH